VEALLAHVEVDELGALVGVHADAHPGAFAQVRGELGRRDAREAEVDRFAAAVPAAATGAVPKRGDERLGRRTPISRGHRGGMGELGG
jgi:hypothetical protein